jgi:hypothetical protein
LIELIEFFQGRGVDDGSRVEWGSGATRALLLRGERDAAAVVTGVRPWRVAVAGRGCRWRAIRGRKFEDGSVHH